MPKFSTDAGAVILFGSFLKSTGLLRAYPNGNRAEGRGTGGGNNGWVVTLHRFAVGGKTFDSIPTFMTQMTRGAFSSWTEAGNFGYEILSRFMPTFDYARGALYLDDSPLATGPPRNRAGFVADKEDPNTFVILRVNPGSPAAAAKLVSGDRIVEIDRLCVVRGTQQRDVILVLP